MKRLLLVCALVCLGVLVITTHKTTTNDTQKKSFDDKASDILNEADVIYAETPDLGEQQKIEMLEEILINRLTPIYKEYHTETDDKKINDVLKKYIRDRVWIIKEHNKNQNTDACIIL